MLRKYVCMCDSEREQVKKGRKYKHAISMKCDKLCTHTHGTEYNQRRASTCVLCGATRMDYANRSNQFAGNVTGKGGLSLACFALRRKRASSRLAAMRDNCAGVNTGGAGGGATGCEARSGLTGSDSRRKWVASMYYCSSSASAGPDGLGVAVGSCATWKGVPGAGSGGRNREASRSNLRLRWCCGT